MSEIKKIKYNNECVIIEQLFSESNKRFTEKLNFIKKLEEKKYNWKDAKRLSNYWYNIKFNECKYDKEIYQLIKNLEN